MGPWGIPTYRDFKADRLGAERGVHHSSFKEGSEEEEFLLLPQRVLSKEKKISLRASCAKTLPQQKFGEHQGMASACQPSQGTSVGCC